ncbi:MAG: hypothetical protein MUF78_10555 [Candidatus Edwardsbacteria bacterium]|nr:hypothetical protein [Candidatus Edwardsbacteria bacterium]
MNKAAAVLLLCSMAVAATAAGPGDSLPSPKAVPALLNYQGYLAGSDTLPFTGSTDMVFNIYDQLSGGAVVWGPETHNGVPVTKGFFNVQLGAVSFGSTVFNGSQRYLEISVNGQTMAPRKPLSSVGYAIKAQRADTAAYAASAVPVAHSHIGQTWTGTSGNIGLYTSLTGSTGGEINGLRSQVDNSSDGDILCGRFYATGTGTGDRYGVYAGAYAPPSSSSISVGVFGSSVNAGAGDEYGGKFNVMGGGTGTRYGVYSSANGALPRWAGYFVGDVHVTGTLSKGAGSFLIDHPLDPQNKTLRHNFVESPENLCLYRGKVAIDARGSAIIKMPGYFAALTEEDGATVSLTPIGKQWFGVSYEWNAGFTELSIYGDPGKEVSYVVYADRDDPVMRTLRKPVEEDKGNGNFKHGKLLYPEAYGYPQEMGVNYEAPETDDRQSWR